MSEFTGMMSGSMMWGVMFGGGLVLLLVIAVLILSIFALVKYNKVTK